MAKFETPGTRSRCATVCEGAAPSKQCTCGEAGAGRVGEGSSRKLRGSFEALAGRQTRLVADGSRKEGLVRRPAERRPLPLLTEQLLRPAAHEGSVRRPPEPQVLCDAFGELLPRQEVRPARREGERTHARPRQREGLLAAAQVHHAQRLRLDDREPLAVGRQLRARTSRRPHLVDRRAADGIASRAARGRLQLRLGLALEEQVAAGRNSLGHDGGRQAGAGSVDVV